MFIRRKNGQSLIEYSILTALFVAAMIIMSVYVKRGIQGNWHTNTASIFPDLYERNSTVEHNPLQIKLSDYNFGISENGGWYGTTSAPWVQPSVPWEIYSRDGLGGTNPGGDPPGPGNPGGNNDEPGEITSEGVHQLALYLLQEYDLVNHLDVWQQWKDDPAAANSVIIPALRWYFDLDADPDQQYADQLMQEIASVCDPALNQAIDNYAVSYAGAFGFSPANAQAWETYKADAMFNNNMTAALKNELRFQNDPPQEYVDRLIAGIEAIVYPG